MNFEWKENTQNIHFWPLWLSNLNLVVSTLSFEQSKLRWIYIFLLKKKSNVLWYILLVPKSSVICTPNLKKMMVWGERRTRKCFISWADYQADWQGHPRRGHLNPVFLRQDCASPTLSHGFQEKVSGHEEMIALAIISAPMHPLQVEFGWWSQRR